MGGLYDKVYVNMKVLLGAIGDSPSNLMVQLMCQSLLSYMQALPAGQGEPPAHASYQHSRLSSQGNHGHLLPQPSVPSENDPRSTLDPTSLASFQGLWEGCGRTPPHVTSFIPRTLGEGVVILANSHMH